MYLQFVISFIPSSSVVSLSPSLFKTVESRGLIVTQGSKQLSLMLRRKMELVSLNDHGNDRKREKKKSINTNNVVVIG